MKNYHLPQLWGASIICLLFWNCNDDDRINYPTKNQSHSYDLGEREPAEVSPNNPLNPYDSVGIRHNLILHQYLELDSLPSNLLHRIEVVKNLLNLPPNLSLDTIASNRINDWIENPESVYDSILANPGLSTSSKARLVDFFEWIELNIQNDSINHHAFILNYEDQILGEILNNSEREIILSVTSLARHSFRRKKRKDKDWEINVTNFVGGYHGILTNSENAILYSLCIGLTPP